MTWDELNEKYITLKTRRNQYERVCECKRTS